MVTIGTPKSATATKVLLCGSGELGKEFVIELQRYGVEVIALDKYADAPAMQVAHRSYVVSMLDGDALREIVEKEKPDYIVPEVEAIATQTLMELEKEGFHVIPTARATWLTMNAKHPPSGCRGIGPADLSLSLCRDGRRVYRAVKVNRDACVVKPIMSRADTDRVSSAKRKISTAPALCTGRRTCRRRKSDRGGICRFRLRNHSVDRSPYRRHFISGTGRTRTG